MGKAGKITEMLEDRLCARVVCESEVYERVVCERGVCVCVQELCVQERVVCRRVVCVCVKQLCVKQLYVTELCVWQSCVKELCDNVAPGGQEEEDVAAARYRAEKQEPHTMMWGTQAAFNVTTENHQACSWF